MALNQQIVRTALFRPRNSNIINIYQRKIIKYGRFQEVHDYKQVRLSFKPTQSVRKRDIHKPKSYFSMLRSKQKIIQIIKANHQAHGTFKTVFFTSTFRKQYKNRKVTDKYFRNFIRRLNKYANKKILYISVPETHRNGAYHYHTIFFNLPYISKTLIEKQLWSYGYTNIQSPRNIKSISNYVSKYVTKAINSQTKKNQKTYLSSRGLILPKTEYTMDGQDVRGKLINQYQGKHKTIKTYESNLHISQTHGGSEQEHK